MCQLYLHDNQKALSNADDAWESRGLSLAGLAWFKLLCVCTFKILSTQITETVNSIQK